MVDPLSVTSGIAGFLSLAIQITEALVQYYTKYEDQDNDIGRIRKKLKTLLNIFQCLETELQKRVFHSDEKDLLENIEESVRNCHEAIQEFRKKLNKFNKNADAGMKNVIKTASHQCAYPFRESTLKKLNKAVGEIHKNLFTALHVLHIRDDRKTQNEIVEVKSFVDAVRTSQILSDIRDWLKASDVAVNHYAECAKRHSGTGGWLIKGRVFANWLSQKNSFLWLSGFAGFGKSVLCSTAIEHCLGRKGSNAKTAIAFFYFTFRDDTKRDELAMLKALILQLSNQLVDFSTDLVRLRESYRTIIPPSVVLKAHLQRLIQNFDHVYVLLDALDECDRYSSRPQVLCGIQEMRDWRLPGLHLLATSRREPDIRDSFNLHGNDEMEMRNEEIDQDIKDFISKKLMNDPTLQKLNKWHDLIQTELAARAQGV